MSGLLSNFWTLTLVCLWSMLHPTTFQFTSLKRNTQFSMPVFDDNGPTEKDLNKLFEPMDNLYQNVMKDSEQMESKVAKMRQGLNEIKLPVEKAKGKVSRALLDRLEALEKRHGIKKEDPEVIKARFSKCKSNQGYKWMKTGSFCVRVVSQPTTWNDAKDACIQEKSRLVKLDSLAKIHSIKTILPADKSLEYYIGANNLQKSGLIWQNGSDLDPEVNMWHFNQPSYHTEGEQTREDCVAILYSEPYKLHYWDDVVCSVSRNYICELI